MASKVENKLKEAKVYKDAGNELYKAGDYRRAAKKYLRSILFLKGIDSDVHGGSPMPIMKGLGYDVITLTPELEQVKFCCSTFSVWILVILITFLFEKEHVFYELKSTSKQCY